MGLYHPTLFLSSHFKIYLPIHPTLFLSSHFKIYLPLHPTLFLSSHFKIYLPLHLLLAVLWCHDLSMLDPYQLSQPNLSISPYNQISIFYVFFQFCKLFSSVIFEQFCKIIYSELQI